MRPRDTQSSIRLKRAQEKAARRSGTRAVAFAVVALVAAATAVIVFMRYLDEKLDSTVRTQEIVVAAIDLPLGTSLGPEHLDSTSWPAGSLPTGFFNNTDALLGRVVVATIFKGEPILSSRLADSKAGTGLAAVLPEDMLAVSVRVDDVVGVAGFIHPGDNVDVIVTMRPTETSNSPHMSKIILQNIKVMAVGKKVDRDAKQARKPIQATVATLMVTAEEAERLALAAARGKVLLALRSSLSSEMATTEGVVPSTLLAGRPRPRPARRSGPSSGPKTEEKTDEVIEILRGDRFEKRRFEERRNP
ncbi:Flp pilus assembly protein CpaB [Myxococcota bacterium]